MDIPALGRKKDKDDEADAPAPQPIGVLGDPLATPPADGAATDPATATTDDAMAKTDGAASATTLDNGQIVPNDTVSTNDQSAVGEFKPTPPPDFSQQFAVPDPIAMPAPTPRPEIQPVAEQPEVNADPPAVPEPPIMPPPVVVEEPEDPDKITFIKTYTKEFDDELHRATDSAEQILSAIDSAVREHSPGIEIPEGANEFIEDPPKDGKVERFEDARTIVRAVMERASQAKEQSVQAAAEAAKVYDEVQQFKKETEEQIAELTGDEGEPEKRPKAPKPDASKD